MFLVNINQKDFGIFFFLYTLHKIIITILSKKTKAQIANSILAINHGVADEAPLKAKMRLVSPQEMTLKAAGKAIDFRILGRNDTLVESLVTDIMKLNASIKIITTAYPIIPIFGRRK